jgi:membrane protein DedA with SNARE-associated domain
MHGSIISLLTTYRYVILFPIAALEGPVVSLAAGFLIHTGVFRFWPAYIVLMFGDIVPDSIYYFIGYYGRDRSYTKKLIAGSKFFTKNIKKVEILWKKHGLATMFFGKLAYGLALPFLVSAGMSRVPFKRFIRYALPITLFQYALFIGIGYSSGGLYIIVSNHPVLASLVLSGMILAIVGIFVLVSNYAKSKIVMMEEQE